MATYEFTNNWFEITAKAIWDNLIPQINPARILEIGSYEGASACYLIDKLGGERDLELHCIDTWQGGVEHGGIDMTAVEARFDRNLQAAASRASRKVDVHKHKMSSDIGLAKLIASGARGTFDFVYVDGSHQAPDVLLDAVLGFRLLRVGGVMAFDDYLWHEGLPTGIDHLRCPKPAIDAFVNLHIKKLGVFNAPLSQLYIQKQAE